MPNAHMQFVSYVSCPNIAATHLREWWIRFSQYYVYVPNTPPTFAEMLEDEYDIILDALDAQREEDLADASAGSAAFDAFYEPLEDAYSSDEPACGDCGGCCECLGDPEVEYRFDTLAEQEEFYRETS